MSTQSPPSPPPLTGMLKKARTLEAEARTLEAEARTTEAEAI